MSSSSTYGQTSSCLWGPTLISSVPKSQDGIEVSVHTLPRPLQREFKHVFPEQNLQLDGVTDASAEFLAIPTNQRARENLVGTGSEVEAEKDRLLNVFMKFARILCDKIRDAGYWADFIDPCSGLPMLTRNCNTVFSEVDCMEVVLGYRGESAGFCKILHHPKWGSSVYPATIFAYAPRDFILQLVQEYPIHIDPSD